METNKRVKTTVYIVSGIWSLALLVAGVKLPGALTKILGALPILVVGFFALFDQLLWRQEPVLRFVKRPKLIGTWRGEFISIRDSDGSGEREHDPKPMYLVIRQTFIGLSVTFISEESGSYSFAEDLRCKLADQYVVYYQYTNTPDLRFRPSSPIHDGGAKLTISGSTPTALTGEYWTNRASRGTFSVSHLGDAQVGTWEEAVSLKAGKGKN